MLFDLQSGRFRSFFGLQDVLRVFSMLVSKKDVCCEVVVDEKRFVVPVPTEGGFPGSREKGIAGIACFKVLHDCRTLYILRSYCRGDTNEELSFCAVLVSAGWSRILLKWTPFLRQGARVILYKLSQPRCLSLERSTQCNRTNPYKSESSKDSVFFHSEFIHRKRRHQLI